MINDSRTAYKTAEAYMESKNYLKAIDSYSKVSVEDSYYESAKTRKQEAIITYKTSEMTKAEEAAATGDYAGAIAILYDMSEHLDNDSDFSDKKEYYAGLVPMNLTEMETFDESDGWGDLYINADDHLGNSFNNCYIVGPYTSYGSRYDYAEYYVNAKYVSISGIIATGINQDVDEIGRVEIYGDDELLYTSENVTAKTEPFNFNVNITGKKYYYKGVDSIYSGFMGR